MTDERRPARRLNPRTYTLFGLALAGAVACAGLVSSGRNEQRADVDRGDEVVLSPRRVASAPVEHLVPHVHARLPHDPEAFTQGLVYANGRLFESTGLVGQSTIRELDPATGGVVRSNAVPEPNFAEGLALVGDELVQLTWQNHVAFVYGRDDFRKRREVRYETEGWGLCPHGNDLVMSDGSDTLFVRDPATFATRRRVRVTLDGDPVRMLNELECVGDDVYANVWQTERIVRIDLATGHVEAVIDVHGFLTQSELEHADVLNGIAYIPERERFLITGKFWPRMFEVTFEAAP